MDEIEVYIESVTCINGNGTILEMTCTVCHQPVRVMIIQTAGEASPDLLICGGEDIGKFIDRKNILEGYLFRCNCCVANPGRSF